jgi:ribosomal-protein-alanine N-acetyltransferase
VALFRFSSDLPEHSRFETERLILRPAAMKDFEAWVTLRLSSRAFLVPWEPEWPDDDLTRPGFRRRVDRALREIRSDAAYPLLLERKSDRALIGGLTIGLIRRGVAQMATLGYWVGAAHARQGYMSEAVLGAVEHGFGPLRLHRIEAACLPRNIASLTLLRNCGFAQEGRAAAYLKINGAWEDHLLFARIRPERAQLTV